MRDRSGSGVKFNSTIVPPYVRKSPRVSAALPWLYLKGISTGDMGEALSVLLGDDAKGLSANVVSRLKAQWADEHVAWSRRDMSESRYVYWWADGIHTGLRSENSDGQCLLVIIGVKPDGSKERVAIGDGYRETKASWLELLLDLKKRALKAGPRLAVGDGAMAATRDSRRSARCVRSFRVDLCGQISEGERDVEEGPRQLARILRIPCRALAASAHDQRD
jgi:transposase-like protein